MSARAGEARVGRPREYGTRISTQIRLHPDVYEALRVTAEEREVSMNSLVEKAVAYYIARLIPVDEMIWTRDG